MVNAAPSERPELSGSYWPRKTRYTSTAAASNTAADANGLRKWGSREAAPAMAGRNTSKRQENQSA
jgi:hypothetical protein